LLSACTKKGNSSQASQTPAPSAQYSGEVRGAVGGVSTGEHKVISTVNGEDVYEDVFMEWFLETMSLNLNLDMSTSQDEQTVAFLEEYKHNYLTVYAEQLTLLQEADKRGMHVEGDAVDQYRETLMLTYAGDEEAFAGVLERWGFSEESLMSFLTDQMKIQLLYEEVTKDITESAQSTEAYYNENPAEFDMDESRMVRHILVATREEADEIIAELDKGADFAGFVGRSMDTGSVPSGGVIGPFYSSGALVSGGALVAPFTESSYALVKPGDYTKIPAESTFGFHIIILDEIIAPFTQPYEDIKEDLAYQLLMAEKESHFEEFYRKIIDSAKITYVE
jgi:parvulin-like peptidyl-prolyl isomerase